MEEHHAKTVLLVDDEIPFLETLLDGLEDLLGEARVIVADGGVGALEVLRTTHVDVLVTDLRMPEPDGFQLLNVVAKEYPSVASIVMTALRSDQVMRRLEPLGPQSVLDKPIDLDELASAIRSASADLGELERSSVGR